MSTNPDPQLEPATADSTELCTTAAVASPTSTRVDRAPGMHWSWLTDKRVLWVGWQSPELVGVLGPAAGVVFFHWSSLWLVVSALVAVAWAGHELRLWIRSRRNSSGARPGALTTDQAAGTQTASTD